MSVIIVGAGIAGLSLALTCHEIGIEAQVYEAASEIRPLGVGINLQPNAVRELLQLGLGNDLEEIGIAAEEWALYFYGAHPVWQEPRGTSAGYLWPQYSVHRGQLQQRLLKHVRDRLGSHAVVSDARLSKYAEDTHGVRAEFTNKSGAKVESRAALLIGADGIHSAVRAQMHPKQPGLHFSGATMWRGVSRYAPPKSKNAFVMVGGMQQRFICYPIEKLDSKGESLLNWIAELKPDQPQHLQHSDWNKTAKAEDFMPQFQDWDFGWLSVPDIVGKAGSIWEYPMVDRDPLDYWCEGRTALIGDAAHAMYPHGSNGASQAIVDTRVLGAAFLEHGLTNAALRSYQETLLKTVNALVLRARGDGPIGVLIDIEKRIAQGQSLDQAIDPQETANYMARYKQAAGFDRDALNAAPPIISL